MSSNERQTDRRTFLKRGLLGAGSVALGMGTGLEQPAAEAVQGKHRMRSKASQRKPNILVILVDQMRAPVWVPPGVQLPSLLPNLASLRRGAVSFESHYTAANDCSPSRGVLLTGLYAHQTGCLITGGSKLDPGFPTWGTFLRDMGYVTSWWGKWHLNPAPDASLEQYGFSGGTYPSPNGSPGQGTAVDPAIVSQFESWLRQEGAGKPWCSTVSLVNPHDVAWWYRFTEAIAAESAPPALTTVLPPNFETPEMLAEQRKPQLQRSLQDTAARSFGNVAFYGPEALGQWASLMDTYLMLQGYVDEQIGRVLKALAAQPRVLANTVVVFTSDHGEYGGSHGMRGKGASAYEEAIRVPLYVRDYRRSITSAPSVPRTQLTSSADIVALLLTIAHGSNSWRRESRYEHIATRHDISAMCANPRAPGRNWVLHTTDEDVTEFAPEPYAADAPRHVIAIRTKRGKFATYSNWVNESIEIETAGREIELYDYSTPTGATELTNVAEESALEEQLGSLLEETAIPQELRAPLPSHLLAAQRRGMADYASVEEFQNLKVYVSHRPSAPVEAPTPD